jgi:hypothetical protein
MTGQQVMEIEPAPHGPSGPPDLSGVDFWRVVPRAELKKLWSGSIHPCGDGIMVEKRGRYSGLLLVVRGRLAWRGSDGPGDDDRSSGRFPAGGGWPSPCRWRTLGVRSYCPTSSPRTPP